MQVTVIIAVENLFGKTDCKFKCLKYALYKVLVCFTLRRHSNWANIQIIYFEASKFFSALQSEQCQSLLRVSIFSVIFLKYVGACPKLVANPCINLLTLSFFVFRCIPNRHLYRCTQTTRSNTDFSGLVESITDRTRVTTFHDQRSDLQSILREVTVTFDSRISKAVTCQRAPLESS